MGKDKSPEDLVKEKSFEYYKVENELQTINEQIKKMHKIILLTS